MLLILTSEKDLAADYLIIRLVETGRPYLRINSEQLAELGIAFQLHEGQCRRLVRFPGDRTLDLSDVESVWYRRTLSPRPSPKVPLAQRPFITGEMRYLWTGLVLDPQVRWINPIDKVVIGEHKVFQLRLAAQLGFVAPETLISSRAEEIADFLETGRPAICKPIFHGLYIEGEQRYSIYTRRITRDSLPDQATVDLCPVFVQEEVPRSADLRVTLIGEHCFAVRIVSDDPGTIDWRAPGLKLTQTAVSLSPDIERKCRAMMGLLGLRYAAFDFIETPTGDLVFLELNPTGEWAWLEDQLGLPMRDAFIELFYRK